MSPFDYGSVNCLQLLFLL